MKQEKKNVLTLLLAVLLPLIAGGLGGVATRSSLERWYPSLQKPAWNPPGWVFAPVWTVLYALMGVASWLVWREKAAQPQAVQRALPVYGLQLGLNVLWSVIFFGRRRPDLALLEIGGLWAAILVTIRQFALVSRWAAILLVPYQLWVSFAAILNGAIWWLNRSGDAGGDQPTDKA